MTNCEEIAKKLRESGIARNVSEAYVLLLHCIDIRPQLPAVYTYKPALERLADLIDPTCEVALDEELSQEFQGEMFRCNKCNAVFPRINGDYRYCPSCGARVVRDERG